MKPIGFLTLLVCFCSLFSQAQTTRKSYVPSTIDGSGKTDVTLQMQAFFDGVKDSTQVIFPSGKRYKVEGTICAYNRKSIHVLGNGSEIFAETNGAAAPVSNIPYGDILDFWPRKRSQFAFRGGTDIRFEDIRISGGNPYSWQQEESYNASLEAQHNIDVEGTNGVLIYRCVLTHPYGDFIYLGRWNDFDGAKTSNVAILQTEMHDNGRQGVSFCGAENVLVALNKIYDTRRATFDIEPDAKGTGTKNLFIKYNAVGEGRLMFVASGGSTGGEISNVVIGWNKLTGRAMSIAIGGGRPGQRHHITICDNIGDSRYAYNSPRALVEMVNVDNVTVMNNSHLFAAMQADDLPGEGNDAVQIINGKNYYLKANQWTAAERELDTINATPAAKPNTLPSELWIKGIRILLPSIVIGWIEGGSFTVLSKYKKTYQLYGDGQVLQTGTLKAGYNTIDVSGYTAYSYRLSLKVGTKTYSITK